MQQGRQRLDQRVAIPAHERTYEQAGPDRRGEQKTGIGQREQSLPRSGSMQEDVIGPILAVEAGGDGYGPQFTYGYVFSRVTVVRFSF